MTRGIDEGVDRMRAVIGELKDNHWKSCCELLKTHHGDTYATYNLFFRDFFSNRALPAENDLAEIYRFNITCAHDGEAAENAHEEQDSGMQSKICLFEFPLDRLTTELILTVAQFLHIHQMLALSRVNRYFHAAITDSPSIWDALCRRTWRVPQAFKAESWRETTLQAW